MLKHSEIGEEIGTSNNPENLFVHRFHGNSDMALPTDIKLSASTSTFWKSPYAGDGGISWPSRGVCMKPVISVMSTKNRPKTSVADISKLTVKSILKHRDAVVNNTETMYTQRDIQTQTASPEPQPNLITTGTGKGRPHGSLVRAKTVGKRVQFNGIVNQNSLDVKRNSFNLYSPTAQLPGRRLFLDRQTSTRILGSANRLGSRWQSRNHNNTNNAATLSSGEANIKYQINAFIRKLRLAESEKHLKADAESKSNISDQNLQRKTAAKLRKSSSFSGTTLRKDWGEYDMEKINISAERSNDEDSCHAIEADKVPSIVFDSKSRSISSGSISIESFSSVNEDQIVERTPGGAKVFRPKPNASLYTKYRHITTNENVNKYGYRPNNGMESRGKQSVNFCDRRKTSQILGWLEEVRSAQSTAQLPQDSPAEKS